MLHNIHDSLFKGLFSVRENLLDLIKGTLPGELLEKLDLKLRVPELGCGS